MSSGSTSLWPLLFHALGETLWMVTATLGMGGLAGLVLGVALYTARPGNLLANRPVSIVLNAVVNLVRPIPFIIFITAMLPLTVLVTGTSYGTRSVIFPLAVMATFGTSRIVEQNLVALDPGVIEAARAVGAGPLRIIMTIVIPEALGPLVLGYTFLFVAIVDMTAVVGAVSGGGLGDFALQYGYQRFNQEVTLVTVGVIIALVQVAQIGGNALARRVMRR